MLLPLRPTLIAKTSVAGVACSAEPDPIRPVAASDRCPAGVGFRVLVTGAATGSPLPTTSEVDGVGDRVKMRRVHTRPVVAQMVKRQPLWDRPNKVLVHDAVRPTFPAVDRHLAVALIVDPPLPNPATVRVLDPGRSPAAVTLREAARGLLPAAALAVPGRHRLHPKHRNDATPIVSLRKGAA